MRAPLVSALALASLVLASIGAAEAGTIHAVDADAGTRRVVGAEDARVASSIAKLTLQRAGATEHQRSCTAVLLAGERYVLTAAHCLYEIDPATGLHTRTPARGPYTLIFGFQHRGVVIDQKLVVRGEDIFADDAVTEVVEHDVAIVRLPDRFETARARFEHGRLVFARPASVERAVATRFLRGIPLLPAELDAAPAARRSLFAYSADEEIGGGGRWLTVDGSCEDSENGSEPTTSSPSFWAACHAYPGGSGGPLLQRVGAERVYVAGVAIESELDERRAHIVRAHAFRGRFAPILAP